MALLRSDHANILIGFRTFSSFFIDCDVKLVRKKTHALRFHALADKITVMFSVSNEPKSPENFDVRN